MTLEWPFPDRDLGNERLKRKNGRTDTIRDSDAGIYALIFDGRINLRYVLDNAPSKITPYINQFYEHCHPFLEDSKHMPGVTRSHKQELVASLPDHLDYTIHDWDQRFQFTSRKMLGVIEITYADS
jgi:hypothetical protein